MTCRLVEADQTTHVNTNYVLKSDDGAYIYIRLVLIPHLCMTHTNLW